MDATTICLPLDLDTRKGCWRRSVALAVSKSSLDFDVLNAHSQCSAEDFVVVVETHRPEVAAAKGLDDAGDLEVVEIAES